MKNSNFSTELTFEKSSMSQVIKNVFCEETLREKLQMFLNG